MPENVPAPARAKRRRVAALLALLLGGLSLAGVLPPELPRLVAPVLAGLSEQ